MRLISEGDFVSLEKRKELEEGKVGKGEQDRDGAEDVRGKRNATSFSIGSPRKKGSRAGNRLGGKKSGKGKRRMWELAPATTWRFSERHN